MKKLIAVIALFLSINVYANSQQVDVIKFNIQVNGDFMQKCMDNLVPYESNTLACEVFEIPEGRRILNEGTFVGTLRYIQMWSQSSCSLKNADRIYLRQENNQLLIVVSDKECLEIMKEKIEGTKLASKMTSIFVIKD